MWRVLRRDGMKSAAQLIKFIIGQRDDCRATDLADGADDALTNRFEHLRFRKHDVAAFHLLDPLEMEFSFQRPVRFTDMEGGQPLFVEPTEIADRYHRALKTYLTDLQRIVLETAVDYHRVITSEAYEHPMMRFLVGRTRGRGVR